MRKRLTFALTLILSFAFAAGAMALNGDKTVSADHASDALSVSAVGLVKSVKGNPEISYGINKDYTLAMYKNMSGKTVTVNSGNGVAFTVDEDFQGYNGVKVVAGNGDEVRLGGEYTGNFGFAFSICSKHPTTAT